MSWLEIIGFITVIYYIVYFVLPWFIDCDIQLYFKSKFGQPIEVLKGQIIWITGASSGIGESLAYELAKIDCKLVLSARREEELKRVKENCLKFNSNLKDADIHVLPLDLCNLQSHEKALNSVIEKFGKLDILVNNAGRSQRANWEKIDVKVDKELFEVNVFSLIALSRLVYRHFVANNNKKGYIVVNSSLAGLFGVPFSGSYTGSKHALHGYFESLRLEKLGVAEVDLTLICPGAVATPILTESFTEEVGKKFGEPAEMQAKNKLQAERCAYLMAVAMANRVKECWIAHSVSLQLTYLARYYPNLAHIIVMYLGQTFFQRLRDNRETVKTENK
ncbi:dehydrogenase/reductase SDR family member 7 [Chelonus insularis]|uniref:dehydrogenase/reductase SDR family member 7 n=1 Tax=Chelonus insularis TaxID=460826 RepID=UPI00158D5475|nr:dehydrogenase/reductase SDR family member 7 [Chelonus insularis]